MKKYTEIGEVQNVSYVGCAGNKSNSKDRVRPYWQTPRCLAEYFRQTLKYFGNVFQHRLDWYMFSIKTKTKKKTERN